MQFDFSRGLVHATQEEAYKVFLLPCVLHMPSFSLYNNCEPFLRTALQETSDMSKVCGEDLVSSVVEGINATLMAYGQTGSGKTFTMTGTAPGKISREAT